MRYCYLTYLQQENCRYSICTEQISKAVQFIRANYWYGVLEVISFLHILLSFRRRPSALLWIKAQPAWLHNGPLVQLETGWSKCFSLPSRFREPRVLKSPVKFLKDTDLRSFWLRWNLHSFQSGRLTVIRHQQKGNNQSKAAGIHSRAQPLQVWSAGLCVHVLLRDPF